ncbi:hypothetical protein EON83_10375 [bacterium]|nr:MAG: hypothetical protein EON83_10375 [bacterium]
MDTSLNADAALRAYLPPESWNGDAQHRFVFRTEDGEEEALLARLAVVRPDEGHRGFEHCVVLRPDRAETARIFIAENLWYRSGRKKIDRTMTPRAARRFNWSLFEERFNHSPYVRLLSRFWSVKQEGRKVVLRVGASGWGDVLGFKDKEPENNLDDEGFIWNCDCRTSHDQKDLRFLRQTHCNFRRQIRARWNQKDGEIQTALKWQALDEQECDAIAFHCQKYDWQTLQKIAALVLMVRVGRFDERPHDVCDWSFVRHRQIEVGGVDLWDDAFLFEWRAAIVQVFQPDNVDENGKKIEGTVLCVRSHVESSELGSVQVEPFSQHELLESQLKLREWTLEHFSADEAARLLAL